MKTTFRKSFLRDIKKIKSKALLRVVQEVIEQVETAIDLQAIANLKKMSGSSGFYRIRVGDYRIGVAVETVEFVRCLDRRDLYKYFP